MASSAASNSSVNSFEIDELNRIEATRMELRKEKDLLREPQLKSDDLVKLSSTKGLALDLKSLSEARLEDRKHIQELESKLQICSEEIGSLQCQVNMRNIEANWLGEHVHSLELKLTEMSKLQVNVNQLTEELLASNSECWSLRQELENKEVELHNSKLHVERLEGAISSISLDSECELESMKLDLMNLEQMASEAMTFQEKATQEKKMADAMINEFSVQIQGLQKVIKLLEEENRDLRDKLELSEQTSKLFVQRIEEYLNEWLEKKGRTQVDVCSCSKPEDLQLSKETGIYEEVLGPILSKFGVMETSDLKDEMGKMSQQIYDYELLVEQLKDELRKVKLKAKEEAEDLTQEMAELRYQTTGMLEEERERRAYIEQASLQRISELEVQVQKEKKKSFLAAKHLVQVQKLAESRSMEIQHLRNMLEDELRKVKLKAKEEAEDLTQEMAELRYQTTGMLEEERERRAYIEQASLQRISELEVQVQKEKKKSFLAAKHLVQVQKLAESRSMEIQHLRNMLEESCTSAQKKEVHESEERLIITDHSIEPSEVGDRLGQLSIACFPEERHLSGELNHEDSSD